MVSLEGAWVIDVLDFRKRKVFKCKWDQINRYFAFLNKRLLKKSPGIIVNVISYENLRLCEGMIRSG